MTASDQFSRIAPYVGRLLDDEYVQDQLTQGLTGLRQSSRRVTGKTAGDAISDRRLADQLRASAGALGKAVQALSQPPAPPRHPGRRAFLLISCGVVGVLVWRSQLQPPPDPSGQRS